MKLSVIHRTTFHYSEPARENVNEIRLGPLATARQAPDFFVLNVIPATRVRKFTDLLSNQVHQFELVHPHNRLIIESRSVVSVAPGVDYQNLPYGTDHDELPVLESNEECCEFLLDSTYVRRTPEIWREALDIKADSTDIFQTCYALMASIFENCTYQSGLTDAATTAEHVFAVKSGVCQDFAHLLLAYCRSLGIPARYASGYVWDPGLDRGEELMRGSQASHAWVEVFIPGRGWVGLDPTNNKITNDQYVLAATGRDYDDVAPVRGTFLGGGHHRTMQIQVDVRRISNGNS